MNLRDLRIALREHPEKNLRFVLPDGDLIPANFHVTEVGQVTKNFIDCGGTTRTIAACVLQTWVAGNDSAHRLTAGRLAAILDLARRVVPSEDLDIEVEYEGCVLSQYWVVTVDSHGAFLTFTLGNKHTDCLAQEICCGNEGPCCSPQ